MLPGKARFFSRAPAGDEQDLRLDQDVAPAFDEDADLLVAEDGQGGALEPDADVGERADLVLQARGDVDAAGPGVDGVDGAEEAVGLQDQLAAQAVLVVDEEGVDAALAELDGGGEPGRAAADDQDGHVDGLDGPGGLEARARASTRGQLGKAVDGLDAARRAGRAPCRTSRGRRRPGRGTARTGRWRRRCPGRRRPWVVSENPDAGREERRGEDFAFQGFQGARLSR